MIPKYSLKLTTIPLCCNKNKLLSGTGINGFNGSTYIGLTDQNRVQTELYTSSAGAYVLTLQNCKATGFTTWDLTSVYQKAGPTRVQCVGSGRFSVAAAVTSLNIFTFGGKTFNGSGTYSLIGG